MEINAKMYNMLFYCCVALMPTIALASKTTYYFTEPAAGRAGYGYSAESACANVNKTGSGNHKNGAHTIETAVENNNVCAFIMTDIDKKGEHKVTQFTGKIHTVEYDCQQNLNYSIYSHACVKPMDLKQQIAEQESINNSAVPVHSDSEHLIG